MRITALALLALLLPVPSSAQDVAILPIKLLDTSGEVRDQRAEHDRRLVLLADSISSELGNAPRVSAEIAATCQPETTACLLSLARDQNAEQALFIVVQKTSTLILQIFANLVDTESGQIVLSRNLSFRGDNDEAWHRAGRFLARQIRGATP